MPSRSDDGQSDDEIAGLAQLDGHDDDGLIARIDGDTSNVGAISVFSDACPTSPRSRRLRTIGALLIAVNTEPVALARSPAR